MTSDGVIVFASEAKNLVGLVQRDLSLPRRATTIRTANSSAIADMTTAWTCTAMTIWRPSAANIREKLIAGVEKRLDADAPVGFLLSGGLDSSLVCAIAATMLSKDPIRTFAIGMDADAIDLKYARQVADYIGSRPHGGVS